MSHKINFNKISFHEKLTITKCKTEYFRLVKLITLLLCIQFVDIKTDITLDMGHDFRLGLSNRTKIV